MSANSENRSSTGASRSSRSGPPPSAKPTERKVPSADGFTFAKHIPDRYTLKQNDEGERTLSCFESPNINVYIVRGQVASASAARRAEPGTIFLDGAAQGAPFLEHEKLVYNLDHHEGVIRAFTVATCEQAMLILMKGLDLRKHEWRIIANEPDLDTIFAIWVLLNHMRLRGPNSRVRRAVVPLLRLEGAIDSHGLEFAGFTGFLEEHLARVMKTLEGLRDAELKVKRQGSWQSVDFLEYAADMLRRIDKIVYRPGEFSGFQEIEEVVQLPIYQNRIAVACRSDAGIYETEQQLKRLYGTRLAMILLQKEAEHYTIRQTDLFLPGNLEQVYQLLNVYDPAVTGHRPENRWGGSTDIGGSPRAGGTRLAPREILEAVAEVFSKPTWVDFAKRAGIAIGRVSAVVALAWAARWFWPTIPMSGSSVPAVLANPSFGFIAVALLAGGGLLLKLIRDSGNPRFFGIQWPAGWDWMALIPFAMVAGAAGGAFAPWVEPDKRTIFSAMIHVLLLPLAAELLFRSLLHGLLVRGHVIQTRTSRWFLSWPVLGSAVVYAALFLLPYSPFVSIVPLAVPERVQSFAVRVAAGFLFGVLMGMIRERSESVFSTYLVHVVTALAVLGLVQIYPSAE